MWRLLETREAYEDRSRSCWQFLRPCAQLLVRVSRKAVELRALRQLLALAGLIPLVDVDSLALQFRPVHVEVFSLRLAAVWHFPHLLVRTFVVTAPRLPLVVRADLLRTISLLLGRCR